MSNKKKKIINYDGVRIIYREEDDHIKLIKKYIKKALQEMKDFYKFKSPKIAIEFFYSRKEFDKKIGYKTPSWLVGFTLKNNIYLFSPLVIEKVSNHKKTEVKKILTHETCHVFNGKINKNSLMWMDEGAALLLAGQKKTNDFTKEDLNLFYNNFFCKNIGLKFFSKNKGYKISYWAIQTVVKMFNKKKILELIKINPKIKNCKQKIEKILKLPTEKFLEEINKNSLLSNTKRGIMFD